MVNKKGAFLPLACDKGTVKRIAEKMAKSGEAAGHNDLEFRLRIGGFILTFVLSPGFLMFWGAKMPGRLDSS